MGTLLLFFDGVGLGADDAKTNPFAAVGARRLAPLAGREPEADCAFEAIDATLGVPGLPQSATGQTTLLTGVNAARHLGRHHFGIPGPTLWPLLEQESVFLKLVRDGKRPTFANAYTREHLDNEKPRWSATTRAVMASGVPLRLWDEEGEQGLALYHDYTGDWMLERGFRCRRQTAREAATVLGRILDDHDFVLYEYFLSDLIGHRGTWERKVDQARRVEELVDAVLGTVDQDRHRVLVTSDHGNLEEGGHSQHTLNPVPLLGWGAKSEALVGGARSLEDLTPRLTVL